MQTVYSLPKDRMNRASRRFTNARPVLRTVDFRGIPVSIEIEVGDTKSGVDENGEQWMKTYSIPYGEIPSSKTLADGDGVDVYLGNAPTSNLVFVVHQRRKDGSYDEPKVMLNFGSQGEAVKAYKDHGPSWGFGSLDTMTVDQFIHGFLASNRKV